MTNEHFLELLSGIDDELIIKAEKAATLTKLKTAPWAKWISLAACLFIVAFISYRAFFPPQIEDPIIPGTDPGGDIISGTEGTDPDNNVIMSPEDTEPDNNIMSVPENVYPIVSADRLSALSPTFTVGSITSPPSSGAFEPAPPAFYFSVDRIIVRARVYKNLEDTYCELGTVSYSKPKEYRLILMQTLEVINGKGVPDYFFYMIPNDLYVDMSVYDSLLISMSQIGAENYTVINADKKQIEALPQSVFSDPRNLPQFGNIIAFSDGIFDESLWKTESWLYGYQFAKNMLARNDPMLCVSRGSTEREVIENIKKDIRSTPSVLTLSFESEGARAAIEFVKPFENGVFAQRIYDASMTGTGAEVVYRRYINGCVTDEYISINFETEQVEFSEVKFFETELAAIYDLSAHIASLSEQYKTSIPTPPHTSPEGKELYGLSIFGWYVKTEDHIYAVIKTAWKYSDKDDYYIQYYDDAYVLIDAKSGEARDIGRDELTEIVGTDHVYQGPYDEGIVLPAC